MGWIRDDIKFGQPVRCFFFSSTLLEAKGLSIAQLLTSSFEVQIFSTLFEGILLGRYGELYDVVRIFVPSHQDGIGIWVMSPAFPKIEEGVCIEQEIITLIKPPMSKQEEKK